MTTSLCTESLCLTKKLLHLLYTSTRRIHHVCRFIFAEAIQFDDPEERSDWT